MNYNFFRRPKVILWGLLIVFISLTVYLSYFYNFNFTNADIQSESSAFEIHFIDVGQADSALVICDNSVMMIDGGNADDSDLIYTYLKKHSITDIDVMIATHAHEDHVGGLCGALNYATVGKIYCPVTEYDNKAFKNFKKAAQENGADITVPKAGESFFLGSASVDIIACNTFEEANDTSIVLRIEYGDTSFLFTGDAERKTEHHILESGYDISSTVLKVGHHGSDSSTSYPFLREIMPQYAIIQVGENNTYGHPDDEVISRLDDAGAKILRTDIHGDIICKSDGKTVSFTTSKNSEAFHQPSDNILTRFVLNTNSKKFHYEDCKSVAAISKKSKQLFTGSRETLIATGYSPCGVCKP